MTLIHRLTTSRFGTRAMSNPIARNLVTRNSGGLMLRVAMAGLMAVSVLVSTTGEAHAANSWASLNNSYAQWTWNDCTIRVGVARDPHLQHAFPNYHIVGGVQVNCTGYHRSIKATVGLNYWEVGTRERAVNGVTVSSATVLNTTNFNTGILVTKDACNNGKPTYWRPVATVTIHEFGTYIFPGFSYRHDTKCR